VDLVVQHPAGAMVDLIRMVTQIIMPIVAMKR